MPIPEHCLRQLSPAEKQTVTRLYASMAVAYAEKTDDYSCSDKHQMLARNRFVDAEIVEVLRIVGDERLMLTAWREWVKGRDLNWLKYPVSKFRDELHGALALARATIEDEDWQAKRDAARKKVRQ